MACLSLYERERERERGGGGSEGAGGESVIDWHRYVKNVPKN